MREIHLKNETRSKTKQKIRFDLYPSHRHHNLKMSNSQEKEKQSSVHALKGKHIFDKLIITNKMSQISCFHPSLSHHPAI